MEIKIRKAKREDLPIVLALIRELAEYERAPGEVTITLDELEKDGFSDRPLFEILLAEINNEVLGMAFYFFSYSTWKGRCIYLEDIIVKNNFRGKSIGKKLFDAVIIRSREFGAKRLQWQVLNWNEPAINFYKKYNSIIDTEWVNGKLTQEQIMQFSETDN